MYKFELSTHVCRTFALQCEGDAGDTLKAMFLKASTLWGPSLACTPRLQCDETEYGVRRIEIQNDAAAGSEVIEIEVYGGASTKIEFTQTGVFATEGYTAGNVIYALKEGVG